MTSSRSKTSITKAWGILVALLLLTGVANAGRKRVVVLEFEGDKAERFHDDVVKLIKKSHTVVSLDKWNGTAEEMSATRLTDKNIKKVAKKLRVDGIVSGVVEKRRDEYILRIKLRSGASGELVGRQVNVKSERARVDSTAARDIKDELIEVIAGLDSNRGGGGGGGGDDDDDDKPAKVAKGKKSNDDDDDDKPAKVAKGKKSNDDDDDDDKPRKGFGKKSDDDKPRKGFGKKSDDDDDDKPAKVAKSKKSDDDDDDKPRKGKKSDDDDNPLPKKSKRVDDDDDDDGSKGRKKVAAKSDDDDDDGGGVEGGIDEPGMDAAKMYSHAERAVDATAGLSFTGRRMSFAFDPNTVTARPAGYKQFVPVPGVFVDATVYPLAFGHKRKDILRGIGLTVTYDRVLALNSQNPDGGAKLATKSQRYAVGGVFRYPLGQSATAPVVGGTLSYARQSFTIEGMASIPNVDYSMLQPAAFLNLPVSPKLAFNLDAAFMLALGAGQIVTNEQYGTATITGFEFGVGGDYMLTKSIFARATARFETLGYAFKQNGMKSTGVTGARDSYFGGSVTAGFLF